ncbi:hypothetical protein [Streptomyces pratensis]|uniref:hypothetical protein n=1 Tax=Streptomyces pratensis TaxID=1169025 RepID=UPI00301ADDDC
MKPQHAYMQEQLMTQTARRRTTGHWLTAVALAAVALTGCSQQPADRMAPTAGAKATSPSASADRADARPEGGERSAAPAETTKKASPSPQPGARSGGSGAAKGTWASADRAPFAGTGQFVTIGKAWTSEGRTRLSVRPAQKKINTRFDTWEITPGTGPFTTVPVADDAQVLLAVPVRDEVAGVSRAELLPHSPARFVTLLNQLDPALFDGIGYDLVFDGAGRVTSLKSLYRP